MQQLAIVRVFRSAYFSVQTRLQARLLSHLIYSGDPTLPIHTKSILLPEWTVPIEIYLS